MQPNYQEIGERIRTCRLRKCLTQAQVANQLGVSNVYVSKLERGITKINLETTFRLTEILDSSLSHLLSGTCSTQNPLDSQIMESISCLSSTEKRLIHKLLQTFVSDEI